MVNCCFWMCHTDRERQRDRKEEKKGWEERGERGEREGGREREWEGGGKR